MLKQYITALFVMLSASVATANDGQGDATFDPSAYGSDKPLPKEVENYIRREADKGGEFVGDMVGRMTLGLGRVPFKSKVVKKIIKQVTGKSADSIGDAVGRAYADKIAKDRIEQATEIYNNNN